MSTTKTFIKNLKPSPSMTPKISEGNHSGRVDINHLIARVRKEKDKENKINLIILLSVTVFVFFIAIMLSF